MPWFLWSLSSRSIRRQIFGIRHLLVPMHQRRGFTRHCELAQANNRDRYTETLSDFMPPIVQRRVNPYFKKTSGFKNKNFRDVFHDEVPTSPSTTRTCICALFVQVRQFWDKKPCNSGWQFEGVKFGTKEYYDRVTVRPSPCDRVARLAIF